MNWCQKCILPDTRPNLRLDAELICNACRAHESKKSIDWVARRTLLQDVAQHAMRAARPQGYDCIIPVSGGKDSTWQTLQCLELGLRPLAVTWRTPARTPIGQKNLDNLVSLGVDHVDYRICSAVEAQFMLKTFERVGSTAVPMHMALFSIPLMLAVRMQIPLVVWGENSAFEYGAASEAHTGFKLDSEWLRLYGVMHGTTANDWVGDGLTVKHLAAYFGPSVAEIENAGVRAVFLGYYLPWDPDATRRIAQENGFEAESSGARTVFYDYADIDDDFISIHHWLKWYKFGFTRLFDNLSVEIRNGRMTRDQALAIVRARGDETPHEDINKLCAFLGITTDHFFEIAEQFRNHDIWKRRDEKWVIPGFLVPDWEW